VFSLIDWVRRKRAGRRPFPEHWRDILRARVPFYPRLTDQERDRFECKLKVFVLTKAFVPAGGMKIDDEVRVVIGAAAARLTMNLPGEHYQRLTEIVVYPAHYKHPKRDGVVVFGEAHRFGTVVLSYQAVEGGFSNERDGHNTALHEFAHALDAADGAFDGTPVLSKMSAYAPWAEVMSAAYLRLRKRRCRSVLRAYGATNEAEFFAVATEAFFEKPRQLKQEQPDLFALLSGYYRVDPCGSA